MKFNPFHDRLGRFANKWTFSSYSANPKMRAAQPSITRSARAGHGRTMNVHRESKGENIGQNYEWMRGRRNATTTATTAQTTTAPPTQQPANRRTQQNNQQNNQQNQQNQRNTQQRPSGVADVANGKAAYAVDGKDLSNRFTFDNGSTAYSIEQVIKAQGFDGQPTLTSDPIAFSNACKASNFAAVRGVGATDAATMQKYDSDLKTGDFYVKCRGGNAHGYGMYAASFEANSTLSGNLSKDAQRTADSYAGGSVKMIYSMTLDKSAKIGTESSLKNQMRNDNEYKKMCNQSSLHANYTMDVGVYAAYKGYDAYIANNGRSGYSSDYTVILNRSKLIIFDANAS